MAFILMFASGGNSAWTQETPSTADFEFLLGEWDLEATQSPGTERQTKDQGIRTCKYVLDKAYIRCDTEVRRSNGRTRKVVSLHNYNAIYDIHESLYYFSNWPIKPIARATIAREDGVVSWLNEFEFLISVGKTEYIRSEFSYQDGVMENVEYMRTSDEPDNAWRINYREHLTRRGIAEID